MIFFQATITLKTYFVKGNKNLKKLEIYFVNGNMILKELEMYFVKVISFWKN